MVPLKTIKAADTSKALLQNSPARAPKNGWLKLSAIGGFIISMTLLHRPLATLLLQPNPPSTIIIDEPELGLHPYAIKLLASLLQEAAERVQLIVSTQASSLLDELSPEQVIVVNQRDGESILERQDPAKLVDWLKEYTLGQLWEKNELGGLP